MPRVTSTQLQTNREYQGTAPDATLVVTMDPTQPLAVGTYVFRLIVVNNRGTPSQPQQFTVVIV